jgi:hypothetical protein
MKNVKSKKGKGKRVVETLGMTDLKVKVEVAE